MDLNMKALECVFINMYLFLVCICTASGVASDYTIGTPCTYFGGARVSSPEGNLVNCTWYASNACCKRTEVTSVFGGMYPLFGASKECSNQVNYLMCYFCSPHQHRWYHRRAIVCGEFCTSVYDACKTAEYEGKSIGEVYENGVDFCRGQKFEVAEGNGNCFKFDPDVFGSGPHILSHSPYILYCIASVIVLLIKTAGS